MALTSTLSTSRLLENLRVAPLKPDRRVDRYPQNDVEAANFVDVLRLTRLGLDGLARQKGEAQGYLLTIAAVHRVFAITARPRTDVCTVCSLVARATTKSFTSGIWTVT